MMDWSALPADVVGLLSDRLGVEDYIRLGAVCVPWRKAVAGRRLHPPLRPQPPWLMSVPCRGAQPTAADFFCLADRRAYRTNLPEPPIRNRRVIGSSDGWLVTADELSEIHILNPLTGVQVPLPSVLTLPHVGAVRDDDGRVAKYYVQYYDDDISPPSAQDLDEMREHLYEKVVVSHSSSSDWTAVLVYRPCQKLAFARPGHTAWTRIDRSRSMDDVTFHKGLLYGVDGFHGNVRAWDLTGPSPRPTPPCILHTPKQNGSCRVPPRRRRYLVESGGDLLQVLKYDRHFWDEDKDSKPQVLKNDWHLEDEDQDSALVPTRFEVFRLDERKDEWVEVRSLGDRALFLGLNNSMSLSTLEHPEVKANCIYFTQDDAWRRDREGWGKRGVWVFDMELGSTDSCWRYDDYGCMAPPTWIMPRLS